MPPPSVTCLSLLLVSVAAYDVYVRGCPSVGTTWFTESLSCLFDGVERTMAAKIKHSGCNINTVSHPNLKEAVLDKDCSFERDGCVHAVITRHPSTFKRKLRRGDSVVKPQSIAVWEAYYATWLELQAELPAGAVRLFRFEDLVSSGCTAALADPEVASFYLQHARSFDPASLSARNATLWGLWKYEPFVLNDLGEHTATAASRHQEL